MKAIWCGWIIIQTEMSCLMEDGPCNFQPSYRGGSLSRGVKSRNKVSLFRCFPVCKVGGLKTGPLHFQMLRPTPAVLFDHSLITTGRWLSIKPTGMPNSCFIVRSIRLSFPGFLAYKNPAGEVNFQDHISTHRLYAAEYTRKIFYQISFYIKCTSSIQ